MWADPATWSSLIQDGVKEKELDVIPYDLHLNYDHWTHRECN